MTKLTEVRYGTVRFQDVYAKVFFSVTDPGCLSRIRLFSIPDPGSELSPSRIQDPRSSSKNLKKQKKWFISSKKYDPGCSSRIPSPEADFYPSRIAEQWVKKAPDPGSGSATLVIPSLTHSLSSLCVYGRGRMEPK